MDPNNPGQTPGGGTPPVWGPPPAPDQPGYGAPPPPPPAPYGAPQAPYGAPPAPYGAPPAPYGAPPGWNAPPAAKSSIGKRIAIIVGVVVIAVVALAVIGYALSPKHAGQVIFTTDAPTASGAATCELGTQVTTITAGTPVYANFFYKSRLTGETVTLTIIKDGSVLDTTTLAANQSNGVDCVEFSGSLGDLTPGVYEFKLTTSKGDTVSDGTLTVK